MSFACSELYYDCPPDRAHSTAEKVFTLGMGNGCLGKVTASKDFLYPAINPSVFPRHQRGLEFNRGGGEMLPRVPVMHGRMAGQELDCRV